MSQIQVNKSTVSGIKRLAFLAVAGFFFLLGALGAVLPGLPATPFLLLTSYFLIRSSPNLNAVLLRSRCFGPILTDWQVRGGVRRDVKIKSIVFVVIAVALTIYLSSYSLVPTLTLIVLATIGVAVILRLPLSR